MTEYEMLFENLTNLHGKEKITKTLEGIREVIKQNYTFLFADRLHDILRLAELSFNPEDDKYGEMWCSRYIENRLKGVNAMPIEKRLELLERRVEILSQNSAMSIEEKADQLYEILIQKIAPQIKGD